jgi:hypothetical protein
MFFHIWPNAVGDVVIYWTQHLNRDAVRLHDRSRDPDKPIRVGELGRALKSAVQKKSLEVGETPCLRFAHL